MTKNSDSEFIVICGDQRETQALRDTYQVTALAWGHIKEAEVVGREVCLLVTRGSQGEWLAGHDRSGGKLLDWGAIRVGCLIVTESGDEIKPGRNRVWTGRYYYTRTQEPLAEGVRYLEHGPGGVFQLLETSEEAADGVLGDALKLTREVARREAGGESPLSAPRGGTTAFGWGTGRSRRAGERAQAEGFLHGVNKNGGRGRIFRCAN